VQLESSNETETKSTKTEPSWTEPTKTKLKRNEEEEGNPNYWISVYQEGPNEKNQYPVNVHHIVGQVKSSKPSWGVDYRPNLI
jgi:hypothetical protein